MESDWDLCQLFVLVAAVCFCPVLCYVRLFHVVFFRREMRESLGTISLLFVRNF